MPEWAFFSALLICKLQVHSETNRC